MTQPKTVKDRLILFLRMCKLTNRDFAAACGFVPSFVSSMRYGTRTDKLERIIEVYPFLNYDWLAYGIGKMFNSTPTNITLSDLDSVSEHIDEERQEQRKDPRHTPDESTHVAPSNDTKQLLDTIATLSSIIAKQQELINALNEKLILQ